MRKIVLHMGVSLDGYIEAPDRDISWHMVDEELHDYHNEVLAGMGGFISGRVTHELMVEYWPTADEDPDASPSIVEFARIWRDMPKIVVSRTLETAAWNTTVWHHVNPEHVRDLKNEAGGDLALSGADLVATFIDLDLIDEYRIFVNPIAIGAGTPLFPRSVMHGPLHLMETRSFSNGVVLLHYRRDDPA